jgi:cyclohexanone monooxygenase
MCSSAPLRRSTSVPNARPAPKKLKRGRTSPVGRGLAVRDAVKAPDDYMAGRVAEYRKREKLTERVSPEQWTQKLLDENFAAMEQIRARVEAIVEDPATAEALKPYYPYACKRPTFHDEYLPTFNKPHVHLVDTAPIGVNAINERGVVHDGTEYPLDVLIYATGFQWMAPATFNMVKGRDGQTLNQKWQEEGTKTFLGLHSSGFPNFLIVSGPQGGGGSFNFTDVITAHADYIAWLLTSMRDDGHEVVDVRQEHEDSYARHCAEADMASAPLRDCISYYNGHGDAAPGSLAYYGGRQWNTLCEQAQETKEPYLFA